MRSDEAYEQIFPVAECVFIVSGVRTDLQVGNTGQ